MQGFIVYMYNVAVASGVNRLEYSFTLPNRQLVQLCCKDWGLENNTNVNEFFFDKKIRNCVYFFTCILPDYMAHEIFKEF